MYLRHNLLIYLEHIPICTLLSSKSTKSHFQTVCWQSSFFGNRLKFRHRQNKILSENPLRKPNNKKNMQKSFSLIYAVDYNTNTYFSCFSLYKIISQNNKFIKSESIFFLSHAIKCFGKQSSYHVFWLFRFFFHFRFLYIYLNHWHGINYWILLEL